MVKPNAPYVERLFIFADKNFFVGLHWRLRFYCRLGVNSPFSRSISTSPSFPTRFQSFVYVVRFLQQRRTPPPPQTFRTPFSRARFPKRDRQTTNAKLYRNRFFLIPVLFVTPLLQIVELLGPLLKPSEEL